MAGEELNLTQLRTFLAVARRRSFTGAAKELYITQPAVSAQVRALKRYYGVELFDLLGRKLFLTPAGEEVLRYAERLFDLVAESRMVIDEMKGLERGRLEVGASTTIGNYLLPRVLGDFSRRYPKVEVHLDIGTTAEIARQVRANLLPLGLVEARVEDPDLVSSPFLRDELVLVVPPDHRWANAAVVAPVELQGEPFLMRERSSGTRALVEAGLADLGIAVKVVMELGNTEAIKQAVMAGLGVSTVSRHAVAAELAAGQLRSVRVPGLELHHDFSMIMHRDKRFPPEIRAFLQCLEEVLPREGEADHPRP